MRSIHRLSAILACLSLASALPPLGTAHAQESESGQTQPLNQVTIDDLIAETQKPVLGADYTGLVWWLPVEFWEISAREQGVTEEQIEKQVAPLRDYTMIVVVVGKIGVFGSIDFVPKEKGAPTPSCAMARRSSTHR